MEMSNRSGDGTPSASSDPQAHDSALDATPPGPSPSTPPSPSLSSGLSDDLGFLEAYEGLPYSTSLGDHATYFATALANAVDSVNLDRSLAAQAQLSGKLNSDAQRLLDKRHECVARLQTLQELYSDRFGRGHGASRVDRLHRALGDIEARIDKLKHGSAPLVPVFGRAPGVIQKYPVEYNQARDKVVERS